MQKGTKFEVLDKGYIIYHDHMGSDLTVANSARVSYNDKTETLTEKDERLIRFLAREGHTSPFRHSTIQFEVYAPLMVARQWWKYIVGSDHTMDAWNESSRRYVKEEPVFYIPNHDEWRSAPENSKQGSGKLLSQDEGLRLSDELANHVDESIRLYEQALSDGVCAEQARLFLPAYGLYVRWYWTGSLQSVLHLVEQRVAHDSQVEFQEYARVVQQIASNLFPVATQVLNSKLNKQEVT